MCEFGSFHGASLSAPGWWSGSWVGLGGTRGVRECGPPGFCQPRTDLRVVFAAQAVCGNSGTLCLSKVRPHLPLVPLGVAHGLGCSHGLAVRGAPWAASAVLGSPCVVPPCRAGASPFCPAPRAWPRHPGWTLKRVTIHGGSPCGGGLSELKEPTPAG